MNRDDIYWWLKITPSSNDMYNISALLDVIMPLSIFVNIDTIPLDEIKRVSWVLVVFLNMNRETIVNEHAPMVMNSFRPEGGLKWVDFQMVLDSSIMNLWRIATNQLNDEQIRALFRVVLDSLAWVRIGRWLLFTPFDIKASVTSSDYPSTVHMVLSN